MAPTETMQPVECGACGWRSRRKTGNVVICPKCSSIAAFQVPAKDHVSPEPASR
jgi:hypothetical protein